MLIENMWILKFFLFFAVSVVVGEISCRTPNGYAGSCCLLTECEPLMVLNHKKLKSDDEVRFLRQSSCGIDSRFKPKVCCPPQSEWSGFRVAEPVLFPTRVWDSSYVPRNVSEDTEILPPGTCPEITVPSQYKCCGVEAFNSDRITGGETAAVDQYPWLALLEYSGGYTNCAGSLISSRYVLTAAHCVGATRFGPPLKVRLAEYNTSSYPTDMVEVEGGGVEILTVIIITIESQIRHEGFKGLNQGGTDDIGLIKLSREAPYTDFIRPICLPTFDVTEKHGKGLRFIIAGWGSNGYVFSEVKQHLQVPHVPLDICQNSQNNLLTTNQICAGGEKGKDSCKGDSGGPLMYQTEQVFVLAGIVSFGYRLCGTKDAPGVYTHVYKYLDWIKKHMM